MGAWGHVDKHPYGLIFIISEGGKISDGEYEET